MLPYMPFATNNLNAILNDDKGARCVYCFGKPVIDNNVLLTDVSTVICPICGIDAVVPASQVNSEETLKAWHRMGFQQFSTQ